MDNTEECSYVTFEGGVQMKIIDYLQTEELEGRTWTSLLLEDDTIILQIERKEAWQPDVLQHVRITKKSAALLSLLLAQIDSTFGIHAVNIIIELTKGAEEIKFKQLLPLESSSDSTETIIKLGDFVIDMVDVNITDPAIVVIDHKEFGVPDLYSIKRVNDGHLSLRDAKDLTKLTPLEFCKKWCEHQITYPEDKEKTE